METRNLTGMRFGLLTVGGRAAAHGRFWLARCACGREASVRGDHLLAGRTRSCGCASSRFKRAKMEKRFSLVNKRFGRLLVVWRDGSRRSGESSHAMWACRCSCGRIVTVRGGSLSAGRAVDCGCEGANT